MGKVYTAEEQARLDQLFKIAAAQETLILKKVKEERIQLYNFSGALPNGEVYDKVHKKQVGFHADTHRMKLLSGGNRTGKSTAGAVEAVLHATGDSRFRTLKPSSGWVVSLTNEVQRDVSQKEILRWLPKRDIKDFIIRHGSKGDPENSIIDKIILRNGQTIGFKSCEQGRESFQGTSQSWIWADEEIPRDIFDECRMRLMDTQGEFWMTMTPLKGLTWAYTIFILNENDDPNVIYWTMEWEDNPWLSSDEIALLVSTMTEEEREARQYGRFTSLCGFAFMEMRREIHMQKKLAEIPVWYKRYISIDYGLDALAAYWIYVDSRRRARIYREYHKSNLIISEAATAIKMCSAGEKISAYYAPPDLWSRRNDTGKTASDIFWENGIPLTMASNNRVQGWMNLHEWLKPIEERDEQTGETVKVAALTMDDGCAPYLWKSLTTIQKDDKDPNDVSTEPHSLTHAADSIRYFVVNWTSPSLDKKVRVPVEELGPNYDVTELADKGYSKYQVTQYEKRYKTKNRFTF